MAAESPRSLDRAGRLLFVAGSFCMLVALALSNITVAGGSYRGVLMAALVLTALADAALVAVIRWGGIVWRLAAGIVMLPTIWIFLDFLRRTRYVF